MARNFLFRPPFGAHGTPRLWLRDQTGAAPRRMDLDRPRAHPQRGEGRGRSLLRDAVRGTGDRRLVPAARRGRRPRGGPDAAGAPRHGRLIQRPPQKWNPAPGRVGPRGVLVLGLYSERNATGRGPLG